MARSYMSRSGQRVDPYYTPQWLADRLIAYMPDTLSGNIIDPCMGGGALLSAVESRFRDQVTLLGLDIDSGAVRSLRESEPSWGLGRANLLDPKSRSASIPWRRAKSDLAAVVINPPFSQKGGGGEIIHYEDYSGRVSPANQFLVEVLKFLSPSVGIFAVLPDGAINADRHRPLWAEIERKYEVSVLEKVRPTTFKGARVATALVKLVRRPNALLQANPALPQTRTLAPTLEGCRCVEIIRGRTPVHSVDESRATQKVPFLHTTNLMDVFPTRFASDHLADEAPFVLIVRVGQWKRPSTVELGRVVLSDCLIALRPKTVTQLDVLQNSIEENSEILLEKYKGTGAQYLTLNALMEALAMIGWQPEVVKAGSPVNPCRCEAGEEISQLNSSVKAEGSLMLA